MRNFNEQELRRRIELSNQTWFKVLDRDDDGKLQSRSGGYKTWRAPKDGKPAPWQTETKVQLCYRGLHITTTPHAWGADDSGAEVYIAEVPWLDPRVKISERSDDKIAVSKMRLGRLATDIDLLYTGHVYRDVSPTAGLPENVQIHKGRLYYAGDAHSDIVCSGGSFNLEGRHLSVENSYGADESSMTRGRVNWTVPRNTLHLDNAVAFIQNHSARVHVRGPSVVNLNGTHAFVYVEGDAAIFVKAKHCTVRVAKGAHPAIVCADGIQVSTSMEGVGVELDSNGDFLRFTEDSSYTKGHTILL